MMFGERGEITRVSLATEIATPVSAAIVIGVSGDAGLGILFLIAGLIFYRLAGWERTSSWLAANWPWIAVAMLAPWLAAAYVLIARMVSEVLYKHWPPTYKPLDAHDGPVGPFGMRKVNFDDEDE